MVNQKIQVRYYPFGREWPSEPLRVAFFHPEFDKADLSNIKSAVTLKFRLFKNGKELDKEKMMIKKHSLGCCVCCYSNITKKDEYNKVNKVNIASLQYTKSLPNGLGKNLHYICLENLLIDPIVFLYIQYPYSEDNIADEGFIEISDNENFEVVRVDKPYQLYIGSKIDPPKEVLKYSPSMFGFDRTEKITNRTKRIKIGEFIEEIQLSYFEKQDDGLIVEHSISIPAELIGKYRHKIPKGVEEVTKWWYSNLWSNSEENEEMLKRLENGEVIKIRDINREEIEELINYYMRRKELSRHEAINRIRDDKFIAHLSIFDEII